MRTTFLRRSLVKNIHIISLAFEMRTPSGIRLNLTLVQFLLADKDHSLPDPTSEKLVRDCIIPAIKKMKEYPGLAEALQSKHGMDFYDTNSTQIFLDNIPTQ